MPSLDKHIRHALAVSPPPLVQYWTLHEGVLQGSEPPTELRQLKRPHVLISFDLEDPTEGWPPKSLRQLRWMPVQRLADRQRALARALEEHPVQLEVRQALASPRLRPALQALEDSLGGLAVKRRRWLLCDADGLELLRLRALSNGAREWLELGATREGLARWPALVDGPGARSRDAKRWALTLPIRPEQVGQLAAQLAPTPPRSAPS